MKHHQRTIGKNDEWLTPPEIFNALGPFDLDPASVQGRIGYSLPWPMASMNISPDMDGMKDAWWEDRQPGQKLRVWLNPPFNRYERPKWMKKMAEHGNGIMLIPAATETRAFFDYVWSKADAICFVKGRPHFHYVDGRRASFNCGTAIALIAYGKLNALVLETANLGKFIHLK